MIHQLRFIIWIVLSILYARGDNVTLSTTTTGLTTISSKTPTSSKLVLTNIVKSLTETIQPKNTNLNTTATVKPSSRLKFNSNSKLITASNNSKRQEISPVKLDIPVFETAISFTKLSLPSARLPKESSTSLHVSSSAITPVLEPTSLLQQPRTNQSISHAELLPSPVENNTIIDNVHFLSFEEWKKQKIIEKNNHTSASSISRILSSSSSSISTASSISSSKCISANDTCSTQSLNNTSTASNSPNGTTIEEDVSAKPIKETEGKVYKDKFNYASVDCAATIVKTNANAKSPSAILKENKDSYLLNQCSIPNKFVVIELCQDILVDSVVIGNFEFFSSMFKEIRISVSDRFPTSNWKVLGEFTAKNIRDVQSFKIENPLIWARYLRLEILSHYGNEFYCPISVVRVHGKTMMEEFKEDTEQQQQQEQKEQEQQQEEEKPELFSKEEPQMTSILMLNQTGNECPIIMPHLKLNAFLKDINQTQDYCLPQSEPITSTAIPTTQESIYKNIMKRLSLLESNATLSLLYIEEQSKLLSTAFSNLEKRQTANFNALISSVNVTLINQLTSFKEAFNSLHDQYGNLYETQLQSYHHLLQDSNKKVSTLTSELTFQKRVTMFNSIIIICLLVYVILTRDTYIDVQQDDETEGKVSTPISTPFKKFTPTKRNKYKKA